MASVIGIQNLPAGTFYRPRVTQGTSVANQGTAGAAADEKAELVRQKMTITRTSATAVTYGGYVNVSRQDIDFSTPQIMDIVVRDLAARYAIQTELATGISLRRRAGRLSDTEPHRRQLRSVRLCGRQRAASTPRSRGKDGSFWLCLPVGWRYSVRCSLRSPASSPTERVCRQTSSDRGRWFYRRDPGLDVAGAHWYSSGAVLDGRYRSLRAAGRDAPVTEPSVLGVQVAYAGYFTPLRLVNAAIVPLTAT